IAMNNRLKKIANTAQENLELIREFKEIDLNSLSDEVLELIASGHFREALSMIKLIYKNKL
ncbi:MAG: hypothetical protein V1779_05800, partial [bacterium]